MLMDFHWTLFLIAKVFIARFWNQEHLQCNMRLPPKDFLGMQNQMKTSSHG